MTKLLACQSSTSVINHKKLVPNTLEQYDNFCKRRLKTPTCILSLLLMLPSLSASSKLLIRTCAPCCNKWLIVQVQNLSGGELQRVAIILCLGQPADIYLIDEPSAYLDSEQRIIAAKVIKRQGDLLPIFVSKFRFILHAKKTGFIVEHDFIMATYLADRVVVYEGTPSLSCYANS